MIRICYQTGRDSGAVRGVVTFHTCPLGLGGLPPTPHLPVHASRWIMEFQTAHRCEGVQVYAVYWLPHQDINPASQSELLRETPDPPHPDQEKALAE